MTDNRFRDAAYTLERLRDTHERVVVTPSYDATLAYRMEKPRGWGTVVDLENPLAPGLPAVAGAFISPNWRHGGAILTVCVSALVCEVDPVQWLAEDWGRRRGWNVTLTKSYFPQYPHLFEIGAWKWYSNRLMVRRGVGFVDNCRLIHVVSNVPDSEWRELHDRLWPCGLTCALLQPTGERKIERRVRVTDRLLAFEHPASWTAQPAKPTSVGAVRWGLVPKGENTAASNFGMVFSVQAAPWRGPQATPVALRQAALLQDFASTEKPITLTGPVTPIPMSTPAQPIGFHGLSVATARDTEGTSYQVRFAHADRNEVSLDYAMLVADPAGHPQSLLRAARALEIAIETTKLLSTEGSNP